MRQARSVPTSREGRQLQLRPRLKAPLPLVGQRSPELLSMLHRCGTEPKSRILGRLAARHTESPALSRPAGVDVDPLPKHT